MPRGDRNIGREILDGIRQLKRGQHGRITTVPAVASIREDRPVWYRHDRQMAGLR